MRVCVRVCVCVYPACVRCVYTQRERERERERERKREREDVNCLAVCRANTLGADLNTVYKYVYRYTYMHTYICM